MGARRARDSNGSEFLTGSAPESVGSRLHWIHPEARRSFAPMGGCFMSTMVVAVSGIGTYSLDFRTPLLWVALLFGVFAVIGLIWVALGSIQRRYTGHAMRCPLDGHDAHVFVARGAAGGATDVVRCSKMAPPSRITCSKACLASIGDA
jgi:hypothetical protein